jgi:hypothetical protein
MHYHRSCGEWPEERFCDNRMDIPDIGASSRIQVDDVESRTSQTRVAQSSVLSVPYTPKATHFEETSAPYISPLFTFRKDLISHANINLQNEEIRKAQRRPPINLKFVSNDDPAVGAGKRCRAAE